MRAMRVMRSTFLLLLAPVLFVPTLAQGQSLPVGAKLQLGQPAFQKGEYLAYWSVSQDGKFLAQALNDSVLIFDFATGQVVRTIDRNLTQGGVQSLAFTPDSKSLVLHNHQGFRFIDPATGKMQRELRTQDPNARRSQGMVLSRDGGLLALGSEGFSEDNLIVSFGIATGKMQTYKALQNYQIRVAVAPDGKTLATWGTYHPRGQENNPEQGKTLQLWDTATGKELRKLKVDHWNVGMAAFSPDNKTLAVSSGRSTFHLFEVESGKEQRRFVGRAGSRLRFSPDGKLLVAADEDGGVQLWETAEGKRLDLPTGPPGQLHQVIFPGDDRILAVSRLGRSVTAWDIRTGQVMHPVVGHHLPIRALSFNDQNQLISASHDGELRWWDLSTAKEVRMVRIPDPGMRHGAESPMNLYTDPAFASLVIAQKAPLLARSNDLSGVGVSLWDLNGPRRLFDLDFTNGRPQGGLGLSSDGSRFALYAGHRKVQIVDTRTGAEAARFVVGQEDPNSGGEPAQLVFSPDGQTLAGAFSYYSRVANNQINEMLVWDLAKNRELVRHKRTLAHILAPAFSPNGQWLTCADQPQSFAIVNVATGRESKRLHLPAPIQSVLQQSFSPDGRTLALAYSDRSGEQQPVVEIWELATGQVRAQFKGHHASIGAMAFSADSSLLATGSTDTTVLVWDLTGKNQLARPSPPSGAELEQIAGDLGTRDARKAFAVMAKYQSVPHEAISVLRKLLPPEPGNPDGLREVDRLIEELDNPKFAVRQKASLDLQKLGAAAGPSLRKLVGTNLSTERQRRLDELLEKLDLAELPETDLRAIRAVEVVERIATAESRELLTTWAGGAVHAKLTLEAREALLRMMR